MKNTFVLLFMILIAFVSRSQAFEFSGEVTLENRYFPSEGSFGNDDKSESSIIAQGEWSHSWDEDRKVVTFIPFARVTTPDEEKTHFDIRELSYVGAWDYLELRAGISKVFWGVTESQHLVDVINQTDFVENPDGEDKLGQPMINPTLVSDYGNFTYFFLPHFRERTFPGRLGRYRVALEVDTDNPVYSDSDKEKHIDHAFRYSHYIGDFDFGLSYFRGTDREPLFVLNDSATKFRPFYIQAEQLSLDAQYIYESWIFKFEGIRKDQELFDPFIATTAGFEYTFSNIYKGLDIGVLAEYLYDERGNNGLTIFYDHSFAGTRLAFNDELGTEVLAGGTFNNEEGEIQSVRLEASRRINNNWKWEFELNGVVNTDSSQLLNNFQEDDYAQLSISFYF